MSETKIYKSLPELIKAGALPKGHMAYRVQHGKKTFFADAPSNQAATVAVAKKIGPIECKPVTQAELLAAMMPATEEGTDDESKDQVAPN